MDIQVQDLIDKIKKDGVTAAESQAAEIIKKANDEAKQIIANAESKALEAQKNAKAEAERLEKASVAAIAQAGRNLIISFRDGIEKELAAIVSSEVAASYNADVLKGLIPEVVKAWAVKSEADSIDVLLSEKDCKALTDAFKSALKDKVSKGLEIKPDASLSAGFKIACKDGSAYYDFSADAVSDLFASYLNPKVAEILKKAVAEG
ncbi:MAG: V-type ATP synthase subunit E [Spirochaetaceae bacterium]|jgi:V/A-type H+-transporting ATPase subunit E|nr:V-type ATP synthase subunit E [Spirochaetaceae bacterium]